MKGDGVMEGSKQCIFCAHCYYSHGCSLASSIMAQERCNLPLIEVKVEILHCYFPIRIYLVEVINGDSCNEICQ